MLSDEQEQLEAAMDPWTLGYKFRDANLQPELARLRAENEKMSAVVEAARKDQADLGRFYYLHVVQALAALDGGGGEKGK